MEPLNIIIDAQTQTLSAWRAGHLVFTAPISTSRFGFGFEPGSYKTPTGLFQISEKIGQDAPMGTVFKGRVPVQESIDWENHPDLITSRILWLEGSEPQNQNTKERYIYIHGTNQEKLVGQAASHGCIRMRNEDVMQLFDLVEVGTEIKITA